MNISRNIKYDIDKMLLNEEVDTSGIWSIIESILSLFKIVLTGGSISSMWSKENGFGGWVGVTMAISLIGLLSYWFLKRNNDNTDLSNILPIFKNYVLSVMGLIKKIKSTPEGKEFISSIEKSVFNTLLEFQKIQNDEFLDKETKNFKLIGLIHAEYINIDRQLRLLKKLRYYEWDLTPYIKSKEELDNFIKSKMKA